MHSTERYIDGCVRHPASRMRSVQEGVGDYGSLLGGIVQLAVTPLGQGPPTSSQTESQ